MRAYSRRMIPALLTVLIGLAYALPRMAAPAQRAGTLTGTAAAPCLIRYAAAAGAMLVDPDSGQSIAAQRSTGLIAPDNRTIAIFQLVNHKLTLSLSVVGSSAKPVIVDPPGTETSHPAWAPDGKQLAFTASKNGVYNIYLVNADGSNLINLTDSQAQDDFAAWSPDGKRIAFRSNRRGPGLLWVINVDGSGLQGFTAGSGPYVWSPDGRYIAAQTPPNRIDVADVATGSVTSVGGGNIQRANPIWSPDSQWVAYVEGGKIEGPPPAPERGVVPLQGKASRLIKMRPDRSGLTPITPANLSVGLAKWAPDADRIAFTANDQLYLINGDGSNLRLVQEAKSITTLDWICLLVF